MEPRQLIAEIDRAHQTLKKNPVVDQKREFVDNVYPLLRLVAETMAERIEEHEGVLADLISGSDPMLTPEIAARLAGTLGLAINLCTDLLKDTPPSSEELSQKARALHEASTIAIELVRELTVIDDDEDDDEGENDESDEQPDEEGDDQAAGDQPAQEQTA